MPITLNPEYNPRLAKLDSKTMPQYKYAVYYKNNDSDLIKRKVFKTRKSAMDFLGEINFVKSHEESTKLSPLSIEEFRTYRHMSEILGKYTDVSISQIFEAYSKYSRDLQDSFGENIELAITNFFRFDVSVTDPPRKGCSNEALNYLIQLTKKYIIYVSCSVSTLARDLKILSENNFIPKFVQPVDMFPNTHHIETIVIFEKSGVEHFR